MQFSIDVSRDLLMAAQFVRQKFEAPAYIPVSVEGADSAKLAIDQWLALVQKSGHIIEARTEERRFHYFFNVRLGLFVITDVKVPRIDVGIAMQVILQVFPMDDAHVLDEPRWVELFGQLP